jgi:hypothetical protein
VARLARLLENPAFVSLIKYRRNLLLRRPPVNSRRRARGPLAEIA